MIPSPKKLILITLLALILTAPFFPTDVRAKSDPFPVYASIQPNVAFWVNIFTQYSSKEGVIHDKQDLNRIYTVIDLEDFNTKNGRRVNKIRIKQTKEQYQAILEKFIRGEPPAGSLEQRVAALFRPDARPKVFQSAMENLRCQMGVKDRFREGLIRSGAYLDEIKQIFRKEGLPEDLAYLPHVESSFNPTAYSKYGAAGTWQFTRSTGKQFMQVGYNIDERWDPMLSSYAAAKLMRQNYARLENWPMAITAYNHGTSGMRRAKRSLGSYEAIFKYYRSRSFKFASRNFYSEFLAARQVARNYHQYFGDLKLDAPMVNREVVLSNYVSLPELARHLKTNVADLHQLNPALRQPVIGGQKYVPRGYRLRLPNKRGDHWEALIAQLPKLYRPTQKRSHVHTVRRGDTAAKIARNHGVRLNALIAANNLNSRATIYIDQKIKIPLPTKKATQVAKN